MDYGTWSYSASVAIGDLNGDGAVLMTFGPLVVSAGPSQNRFALLAVAPSPTNDVARIDFAVAREARVRRVADLREVGWSWQCPGVASYDDVRLECRVMRSSCP